MPVSKRRKPKSKVKRRQMSFREMAIRSTFALDNLAPIENAREYCLDAWVAYVNMQKTPNEKDFITLLQIFNETVCLLNMGYGEPTEEVTKAQDGFMRILERSRRIGSYALDADVMQYIPAVLMLWEDQYTIAPVKAIKAARIMLADMEHSTPDGEIRINEIHKVHKAMVKTKKGLTLVDSEE